jgi:hypothetical protein
MKPGLRRSVALWIACLPLALAAQSPVDPVDGGGAAAPDIKAGNLAYLAGFSNLFRLDLSTGVATALGSNYGFAGGVQIADMDSLAFAADGTLYGVADSPRPALFRVSTATGRATLVAQFRQDGQLIDGNENLNAAIAFTCSGKLLMSSRAQDRLWEVDAATAAVRPIGPLSADIGGIAALGTELLALGVGGSQGLFSLSESSGESTRVPGPLSDRSIPAGTIAFQSDGRLFGVFDLYPTARPVLLELSPVNGAAIKETVLSGAEFTAANSTPVRGLAIAPPACAPLVGPGAAAPIPALDLRGLLLLAALLGLSLLALRSRLASR